MIDHRAYIRRETLISMAINSALTLLFFVLLFGGMHRVPLWGIGNWAFDFIPQSLMIALMGTLVPALLTGRAVKAGRIAAIGRPSRLPANPFARAVLVAVATAVVVAVIVAGLTWLAASPDTPTIANIPYAAALTIKLLYAALLAALVTPASLCAALATPLPGGR